MQDLHLLRRPTFVCRRCSLDISSIMSQASNDTVDPELAAPSYLQAVEKPANGDAARVHENEVQPLPYCAHSPGRRRFFLAIVTAAGFFGPLSGAIYLPALPLFEDVFSQSGTVINATVSVYMVAFAIAVSVSRPWHGMPALATFHMGSNL